MNRRETLSARPHDEAERWPVVRALTQALAALLLVGCYESHSRSGPRAAPAAPAAPSARDGGAPLSDASVTEPEPGDCRSSDYRPTCDGAPLEAPALRLSFDDLLEPTGAWSPTILVSSTGPEPVSVPGPIGVAAHLAPDTVIHLAGTAERLRERRGVTFSMWVREPLEPTEGKAFLRCRTPRGGFEIYRGVYTLSSTVCIGGDHRSGPADCAPFRSCWDRVWHHLVLRNDGGPNLEIFLDGSPVSIAVPEGPDAPYDDWALFGNVDELRVGARAGAGPRSGWLEVADLRIYDHALRDAELSSTACDLP